MRLAPILISIAIAVAVGLAISMGLLTVGQAALAAGGAVLLWFAAYIALASIHAKRFNAECADVMGMLNRGEHEQAAKVWSGWARGITVPSIIVAAARHNIAWTELRRGKLREARALLAENEQKNLKWLKTNQMDSVSALDRALCCALLGELEPARHALAEGGMRSSRAHASYAPMKAFVEAVIACREGRAGVAAKLLDENFDEQATEDVLRPMRVVRAFAMQEPPPLKATYAGELAFLGVEWPEMAAFLAKHV